MECNRVKGYASPLICFAFNFKPVIVLIRCIEVDFKFGLLDCNYCNFCSVKNIVRYGGVFVMKWFLTLYLITVLICLVPSSNDTSGSSPHFLLATGGGDSLIKLWNLFTGSGE